MDASLFHHRKSSQENLDRTPILAFKNKSPEPVERFPKHYFSPPPQSKSSEPRRHQQTTLQTTVSSNGDAIVGGGKKQHKKNHRRALSFLLKPITRFFCHQALAKVQSAEDPEINKALTQIKEQNQQIIDIECNPTKNEIKEDQIIDIDAGNELAVVEYASDLYKFYKRVENEKRPDAAYMQSQPEITGNMRAILVDWLVDVHTTYELSLETLYLTINIIDRLLSAMVVPKRDLQLVGITAMLMASKYEEVSAPEVDEFVSLSDGAYSHQRVLEMERIILAKLEWKLSVPTPLVFLVRFIKASSVTDPDEAVENMAHFLCELGMSHYDTLQYSPSMIAASAVFAARSTLNKCPSWNEPLELHSGFSQQQLKDCARVLVRLHCNVFLFEGLHCNVRHEKLKSVYHKYSDPARGAVTMLPPARL